MPRIDINIIEEIVRKNIRDADKADQFIADLYGVLRAEEKKKAKQPPQKKKYALIVTSERENVDGTISLVGRLTTDLGNLQGTASKDDRAFSLTGRTTAEK